MISPWKSISGAGLGLRREFYRSPQALDSKDIDFWEVAPENWIGVGGTLGRRFRQFSERFPIICHGLSLSLGGPNPLDDTFLARLRRFLDQHQIAQYSEHLSYTTDDGQLYDLLPIPFTEAAARHVVARIHQVQDAIGRRMAIENVSYYTHVGAEMTEIDFVNLVLREADCELLLDVNNIYVNSVNHRYDALAFLRALPAERVAYIHVAGHYDEAPDLLIDTHGADVKPDVWTLLDAAYRHVGPVPTLLERDFNIPSFDEMLAEIATLRSIQQRHAPAGLARAAHE